MRDRPVAVVNGTGQQLPAGEVGEITVTQGWMSGYLDDAEATALATRGGCLHTNDVGFFDQDRNLTVLGRLSDAVPGRLAGAYPRMCEDVMHAHPDVLHAAVIMTSDARIGFIQARPGRTVNATKVLSYLKDAGHHASLDEIVVLTQMPRTFSGKVDRRALAARPRGGGD
jgi:acyl-CoA synthetase (AMP-forming)/AMP-acid ligase II